MPPQDLTLERILGMNGSFSHHVKKHPQFPQEPVIAYAAASAIVLYNPIQSTYVGHLIPTQSSSEEQTLTRRTSNDPHSSTRRDSGASSQPGKMISCLAFDVSGRYLASGETAHAPKINVWDYTTKTCQVELSAHKFGIQCMTFTSNSEYLVSVGFQHDGQLIVWDWQKQIKLFVQSFTAKIMSISSSFSAHSFLTVGARHAKVWSFDPQDATEACMLGDMKDETFVDVAFNKSPEGETYALVISDNGILGYLTHEYVLEKWVDIKVPSGTCLDVCGRHVACGGAVGAVRIFEADTLRYVTSLPRTHDASLQTQSIAFLSEELMVTAYSNRSILDWNLESRESQIIRHSTFYHSDCVWGTMGVSYHEETQSSLFAKNAFATFAADGRMFFWALEQPELLESLDVPGTADEDNGIRCACASFDGRYFAVGDKKGNILVFSMVDLKHIVTLEAHDNEVLSLSFSQPQPDSDPSTFNYLLASGSRDRLIHVFDVKQGFSLLSTIDDHSSSIHSLHFGEGGHLLVSSSHDKSLIFRQFRTHEDGSCTFVITQNIKNRVGVADMDMLPSHDEVVVALSQEKRLFFYGSDTKKSVRQSKEIIGDGLNITKVAVDPTGRFVACAGSDKSVFLYDMKEGTRSNAIQCHAETITSVAFSVDGAKILSTSSDGCVCVWTLPSSIMSLIQAKLRVIKPDVFAVLDFGVTRTLPQAYVEQMFIQVNEEELPKWARSRQSTTSTTLESRPNTRGKWSQRLPEEELVLFSETSEKVVLSLKETVERRYSFELHSPTKPVPEVPLNPDTQETQVTLCRPSGSPTQMKRDSSDTSSARYITPRSSPPLLNRQLDKNREPANSQVDKIRQKLASLGIPWGRKKNSSGVSEGGDADSSSKDILTEAASMSVEPFTMKPVLVDLFIERMQKAATEAPSLIQSEEFAGVCDPLDAEMEDHEQVLLSFVNRVLHKMSKK